MSDYTSDYTPRELGLRSGATWARQAPGEQADVVAETGDVPPAVVEQTLAAGIADLLAEYEAADAEEAFWAGFVDGVRANVVVSLQAHSKKN
jgi:hypothetical protein